MNDGISPRELLDDSVMTKEEVINYILDDFRVPLDELKKIAVYRYRQELNRPGAARIPHHRYGLFWENGTLSILPYDGALRIRHIVIEIRILEVYLGRKLDFEIIGDGALAPDSAVHDIVPELEKPGLAGVVIGSIWNMNFFVNYRLRRHIYRELFSRFDHDSIENYVAHRLRVSDIEHALLNGSIDSVDSHVFQEGALPPPEIYDRVAHIHKKLELPPRAENPILHDYLALDYVFFSDLENGTRIFDESTRSEETRVFSGDLLDWQIIGIPGKKEKYLNISWIEPETLGYLLEKIQEVFDYKTFFMYGKCGALDSSIKTGSIVVPKSVSGEKRIPIANSFRGFPARDFISVDSPLVETGKWLKNALSLGAGCVEMELYDIFKRIKMPGSVETGYYVSDSLVSGFKLSNRFDFLDQRLFLTGHIANKLFQPD